MALNLAALKLPAQVEGRDVVADRAVPVTGGKLTLPALQPLEFVVVWVKPPGGG